VHRVHEVVVHDAWLHHRGVVRRHCPQPARHSPLNVQEFKKGRAHKVWEELADQVAASGSFAVQFNLLGRRLILITDPKAVEVVLRKQKFVPKSRQFYRAFRYMVRVPLWYEKLEV
jgi:hypothetical protein